MLKTLRKIQKTVLNPFPDFFPPIRSCGFVHTQKKCFHTRYSVQSKQFVRQ
jgi:hypothetical protein